MTEPSPDAVVLSTACILPPRAVDNEAFAEALLAAPSDGVADADGVRLRTRAKDIERKTGLRERRFFAPADDPVDVAYAALVQLVDRAGIAWSALDGIVVSSSSIHGFPGLSQQVVARARRDHPDLGHPFVLDIGSNACTSFMYALGIGTSLLATQGYRHVACLAVEFSSRCLEYRATAFGTSTLFGDAVAGVMTAQRGRPRARIRAVRMGSRIDDERIRHIRGAGLAAFDPSLPAPDAERWFMSGPPVALEAIDLLIGEIRHYLDRGVRVDWLIPHQANLTRILYPACDAVGVDRSRLRSSFARTGNTSSASIPLLLDELLASRTAKPGDNVVMVGFGASFTVGSAHLVVT